MRWLWTSAISLGVGIYILPCPPESRRRAPPHILAAMDAELGRHQTQSSHLHRLVSTIRPLINPKTRKETTELQALRQAAISLRHALKLQPTDESIRSLAAVFFFEDYPVDAQGAWNATAYREVMAPLATRHVDWALRFATWMPPVLDNFAELQWLRSESERLLKQILETGPKHGVWQSNHWDSLTFPYAYHGTNNVRHLKLIAQVVRQMLPPWYRVVAPHTRLASSATRRRPQARNRSHVGFSYRASKTKSLEMAHVLGFREDKFEVIFFCWEGLPNLSSLSKTKKQVLQRVNRFVEVPASDRWDRVIAVFMEARLDVLIYFEIGMDPQQYLLAFSRFAPVQVALHGHAQTTGLDSIDFFVSFRACEPGQASHYYSEKLLLLNDWFYIEEGAGLAPTFLSRRRRSKSSSSPFGIPLHLQYHHRYVVCKTLWKLSLEFDDVIAKILDLDPQGIVLVQPMENRFVGVWADRLKRRLPQKHHERVVILPCSLPMAKYTDLVAQATVIVDTTPWGGWQTALEAFALGVPMVTLEHSFLCVGRANARFYHTITESLGGTARRLLERVVAPPGDLKGLAARAVRLAQDRVARASVSVLLRSLAPRLWKRQAGNFHLADLIEEASLEHQTRRNRGHEFEEEQGEVF